MSQSKIQHGLTPVGGLLLWVKQVFYFQWMLKGYLRSWKKSKVKILCYLSFNCWSVTPLNPCQLLLLDGLLCSSTLPRVVSSLFRHWFSPSFFLFFRAEHLQSWLSEFSLCSRMRQGRGWSSALLLLLGLGCLAQKLPTRDEGLFQMQIRDKSLFHDSSVVPDGAEISGYIFRDTPKR